MTKTIYKILATFLLIIFSWFCVCGLVKLITICFELPYTTKIGTGVWFTIILIRVTFGSLPGTKK